VGVKSAWAWRLTVEFMSLRLHNFAGTMRSHLPASMLVSGVHLESDSYACISRCCAERSYEPINVCAARRAIVLVLKASR